MKLPCPERRPTGRKINRFSSPTKRLLITVTVLSLLGSCANRGSGMAQSGDECNAAKSAGFGALVGGLVGAAVDGRSGARKGAAAGAIVGGLGCLAMNYRSKKVRSANEVNSDYMQAHEQLPPSPKVTAYSLHAPPSAIRGENVTVNSAMVLIDGQQQPVQNVEEKLFIVNREGDRKEIKSKAASETDREAGEYANTFSFTPPRGVAEGYYRLESELYVNHQLATSAQAPIVFAYRDDSLIKITMVEAATNYN